jgi:hypothetical protein
MKLIWHILLIALLVPGTAWGLSSPSVLDDATGVDAMVAPLPTDQPATVSLPISTAPYCIVLHANGASRVIWSVQISDGLAVCPTSK